MNKKLLTLISILVLTVLLGLGLYFAYSVDFLFFDKLPWLLLLFLVLGIILAIVNSRSKTVAVITNGKIVRHKSGGVFKHWGTAIGIFILIISGIIIGFLFFPILADKPDSYIFPSNMHFVGLLLTFLGGSFFLADYLLTKNFNYLVPGIKDITNGTFGKYILRRKGINETKYLASQKAAFLLFAILGGAQLITGTVKVASHLFLVDAWVWGLATVLHDIFSLLFISFLAIHILMAIIIPSHRVLLKSWFTGKVPEQYARDEHSLWYEKIKKM